VTSRRTITCDELHALVSCGLDGPASQFEVALASAHVRDCDECAEYEAEVGAFTRLLRAAPLEPLAQPVRVPYGIRYRRPAHVLRGALATAAVAVAAVAIGGSVRLTESAEFVGAAVAPPNDAVRDRTPAVGTVARNRLVTLQELYRDDLSAGYLPVISPRQDDSLGAIKPALVAGNA
jgi:hypothetical protein